MPRLSYFALLGLLSCLVEGATFIVGTTKAVTGSKAHGRALEARDGSVVDILDVAGLLSGSGVDPGSVIYRYSNSATGFAATMTQEQANALAQHPDVLYVVRDALRKTQTTRTPEFLGIEDNQALLGGGRRGMGAGVGLGVDVDVDGYPAASGETDVVIGVLDSGAWPELPSYNDDGLPPPPSHWKGDCVVGEKWTKDNCNNKLVGARYYYQGFLADANITEAAFNDTKSARASHNGHGVHTSTTAAGARVPNVSVYGQASGTARGMAPEARLAIYKVCWTSGDNDGCSDADILAAIDDAIEDGVNILSVSLGGDITYGIDASLISATATFRARQKGVLWVQSIGNIGPTLATAGAPPWVFSVGASTLDRSFPAVAILSDGTSFTGVGIPRNTSADPGYKPLVDGQAYEFVMASDVRLAGVNASDAEYCLDDTLDKAKAAGKIILCKRTSGRARRSGECRAAGAAGIIIYNTEATGDSLIVDPLMLPGAAIGYDDGQKLIQLVKTGRARGTIHSEGTVYGVPAPLMCSFSCRGPNWPDFGILKPDITAPGMGIVAGWSPNVSPSGLDNDPAHVQYQLLSGTSMSCPVVAGLAAYVQGRRPDFTPSMVFSALMTTAYDTPKGSSSIIQDPASGTDANPLAFGNGHVDPVLALDPGLIYDITNDDLINYACGRNSSDAFISALTGDKTTCDMTKAISSEALNYPSFSALYDTSNTTGTKNFVFPRTLTSVSGPSVYTAELRAINNPLITVTVEPETLTFTGNGDQQSYVVKVTMQGNASSTEDFSTAFSRLTWSDGHHHVQSSLSFVWMNVTSVYDQLFT